MLSSSDKIPLKMQNASADPTSRLVPTNEVKPYNKFETLYTKNLIQQTKNNTNFIR